MDNYATTNAVNMLRQQMAFTTTNLEDRSKHAVVTTIPDEEE